MTTTQAIARILRIEGIEWASCYPSNELIEDVANEGIRPIMFRHERGAVMAADGYSRVNDRKKFGVVMTAGGPGAENSMGGIAQAFSDNIPILYLPTGPGVNAYATRPYFSAVRTYQTVSKYGEAIMDANEIPNIMRRAFHHLRNGRPGPVIIEMSAPNEVPEQAVNSYKPPKRARQMPDPSDVKDAVKFLLNAEKPVIWSGQGVMFAGATDELKTFAELTEIPVFCSMPGKSGFDERHPLALGSGSGSTTLPAWRWLQESDALFAVGASLHQSYAQTIPEGKIMIHNTESQEDINKIHSTDVGLPGDAKLTLAAMIEEVKAQIGENGRVDQTHVAGEIAKLKKTWLEEWARALNSEEEPISTYRVIGDMVKTLNLENSIVTHDAGSTRECIMPFYPGTVPHSYIGWGKTTHLGFGIPLMIGAKLANPDKFCLNFMGDGAFGMSGLDIETSVRAGAPITTVVLHNSGMSTYPEGRYATSRAQYGATEVSGNYAKIAEGMGAVGITVTKPPDVSSALKQAQQLNADGRTVLIDIHTNLEARRSNFTAFKIPFSDR